MKSSMALAAFVLAGIGLVGAIVLAAMSKTIPANLWTVTLAALAGGAGISMPATPVASTAPPASAPPG